ncbi:MAG: polynucleotide adenylyltransferase PcnB [Gammaproteobacteria bacterium]|nr:polynucleotide adenylyltransferase PcnB [Gammaproteobacteria bacterium]
MSPASSTTNAAVEPRRIPRSEHTVSRKHISASALQVLSRLHDAGHRALLVGGGVRDLLLGGRPKDFDVATDATPDEIKRLFRNCRLIGRRFRLAHVRFGREIIEVATFRGEHDGAGDGHVHHDGRIMRDNVFGTLEEDVQRRDFTVNALYYDFADQSVIDFVGGMQDLRDGVLRMIGESDKRYREDPVRMLRAVRFAAKLGFRLETHCIEAIDELGELLDEISPARLFEEVLKLFQSGHGERSMELLREHDLLIYLLPMTDAAMRRDPFAERLMMQALANTDARIAQGKPVTPAFLFAAFLWPSVARRTRELCERGEAPAAALQQAASELMPAQLEATALPRRFAVPMREIWQLQDRLTALNGKRALRLLGHPRFRAAYDFLCLRVEAGEKLHKAATFWTEIQEQNPEQQARTAAAAPTGKQRRGRGRRRRRRPTVESAAAPT